MVARRSTWRRRAIRLIGTVVMSWLVVCGHGCSSTSGSLGDSTLIGVVNFQQVLQQTQVGKDVTETLNNFMKDRQALVELEQRELRRLENEILAQGSVLSQAARQQREEQFRRRMAQYQQKVTDLNREVQEKQKELLDRFRKRVERIVGEIAQHHGLVIVVEYGEGTSTLYHQAQSDITDEVIRELDKP